MLSSNISGVFKQLIRLQKLWVDDNRLAGLLADQSLEGLGALAFLNASSNDINLEAQIGSGVLVSSAFSQVQALETLLLRNNSITSVSYGSISYMALLDTLDLSSNQLTLLESDDFLTVSLLKALYLLQNVFVYIPSDTFNAVPLLSSFALDDSALQCDTETVLVAGDPYDLCILVEELGECETSGEKSHLQAHHRMRAHGHDNLHSAELHYVFALALPDS